MKSSRISRDEQFKYFVRCGATSGEVPPGQTRPSERSRTGETAYCMPVVVSDCAGMNWRDWACPTVGLTIMPCLKRPGNTIANLNARRAHVARSWLQVLCGSIPSSDCGRGSKVMRLRIYDPKQQSRTNGDDSLA